jgi:hypothetical protein
VQKNFCHNLLRRDLTLAAHQVLVGTNMEHPVFAGPTIHGLLTEFNNRTLAAHSVSFRQRSRGMFSLVLWTVVAYLVAGPWGLVVALPLILTPIIGLKVHPWR